MKSPCYKSITLVILLFVNVSINAQYQKRIDSLLTLIPLAKEDTLKVQLYKHLCWNYGGLRTELEVTRAYADSTFWLSKKLQYEKGIIEAYHCYGMVNRYEGNYPKALECLQTYVTYCKKNNHPIKETQGWFQIGAVYQLMGDYDKSLAPMEYCLQIQEEHKDWHGYVATMNSIGIVYKRMEKYEKAIESYTKAIAVNKKYNLGRDLTYIFHNIGNGYTGLQQFDIALNWYQKSLDLANLAENTYAITGNLTAIGRAYNLMNLHDKALVFQLKALQIQEDSSQRNSFSNSLLEIGNTYIKLKNYKEAENNLIKGLNIATEINAKQLIKNGYEYLETLYLETKQYRRAYDYGQRYRAIKDSIFSEKKIKQINELQAKYEASEKDKQITILAKEKEIQEQEARRQASIKRYSILALVLLLIVTGLSIYVLNQRLRTQKIVALKNNEIKEIKFRRQLSELKIKALQAQINPHFMFNCMNSINQMILEGDAKNASKYLTKLGELVRRVLENTEEPEIPLKEELIMLEEYMQLEILRFSGKIQYKMDVQKDIDQENTYLPAMILQPFVENAIWHGLIPKKEDGLVTISIDQLQDQLVCFIEDNGVGRKDKQEQRNSLWKKKSLGVKITEERLNLCNKEFQKQFVHITDLKDVLGQSAGTRVEISIPIS
ncbi:tetratricopeptide repeat-containing sensor histidine kinase [Aquimarina pacifica]|uniref:tetratricopeptide repeat-containing sensor histidine kinase n=1 Tax=Aquimarina pacifica TaxID=1296415 RepID=UPI000471554E|nr:tetratricopeptide repeat protein [Aquimarina pacifica]